MYWVPTGMTGESDDAFAVRPITKERGRDAVHAVCCHRQCTYWRVDDTNHQRMNVTSQPMLWGQHDLQCTALHVARHGNCQHPAQSQHNPSIITQHVLSTVNKETEPSKGQHITLEPEARKVEEQHSTGPDWGATRCTRRITHHTSCMFSKVSQT